MFDALFAESFKQQIEMLHAQGYTIAYHLDNNYDSMLDFFLELPRHSGFMHLDQTDLFKAKKILHGHLCLMGNLHPGLAATGTPAAVAEACERLIKLAQAEASSCPTPAKHRLTCHQKTCAP
jgi:uroporphyrinogen-III decarboxylase